MSVSVISSDALRGKKPIPQTRIATLAIRGGHTRVSEDIQSNPDFRGDILSASVAVHLTGEGRCGQAELMTFGGPLMGSIKASKLWPSSPEDLELTISIEDLNSIKWTRNLMYTAWMDYKDNRIAYRWGKHSSADEDDEVLDDHETETDISCAGWSVRLNMRPKSATELRVDMLIVPVKLDSLTEQSYQNNEHIRFPSFRVGRKGGEPVKLLNLEEGPEFFGIGTWPALVDLRTNPGNCLITFQPKFLTHKLVKGGPKFPVDL